MHDWSGIRARDLLHGPASTIEVDATVEEAVRRLSDEGVSGLVVVDGEGDRAIGIVSMSDVIAFLAGVEEDLSDLGGFYFHTDLRGGEGTEEWNPNPETVDDDSLRTVLVGEVMSPETVSVAPDATLAMVARTMADLRIHRVVVADVEEVLGVITTLDVVTALADLAAGKAVAG